MGEETTTQVVSRGDEKNWQISLALVLALKKIAQADSRVEAVLIAEEALDRHAPGWRESTDG